MLTDAEALCIEFSTALSPRSSDFPSVLGAPETSRSSCYTTSLACCADRSIDLNSVMTIEFCLEPSLLHSPPPAVTVGL